MSKSRKEITSYRKTKKTPLFYQERPLSIEERITQEMQHTFTEENGFTAEMQAIVEALIPYIYKLNDDSKKKSQKLRDFYLKNINCRLEQLIELDCTVEGENGQYTILAPGYEERFSLAQVNYRTKEALNRMQEGLSEMREGLSNLSNILNQLMLDDENEGGDNETSSNSNNLGFGNNN